MSRYAWIFALSCLVFTLAGCGKTPQANGPTVVWEGTVTIQGKPLPENLKEAYIQVRPANSQKTGQANPTQATIQKGKYRLEQVPRGEVLVHFFLTEWTGKKVKDVTGQEFDDTRNLVPKSKRAGIPFQANEDNRKLNFDL
ncbi:MAG: hypothetical protein Q4D62_09275 [Planctomycetia bacterium]|nr:hypothetical protein [Planctomycetia bacterium]